METFLRVAAVALILFVAMATFRSMFRGRKLYERTNAYCRYDETGGSGHDAQRVAETPFAAILLRLGVTPDDDVARVLIFFSPVVFAIGWIVSGWMVGFGLAGAGIAASVMIARWRNHHHAQRFADQLPAFLERVRRLVLIGNTLPHAFVRAVESSDPAVKRHVYPVIRRLRYGAPFQDSIEMLSRENNIAELHLLTAYVKTNAKFGGRVGQTLLNLINQLNNKRRLQREIHAATSETRASAVILFGLTAFVILAMSIMNPAHIDFYFGSNRGRVIFALILAWPLMGALAMRRILKLDF